MRWRAILIEWPARLFSWWWTGYAVFLTLLIMIVVTLSVIALVLDQAFGIRWGW